MLALPRIREVIRLGDGRTLVVLANDSGRDTELVFGHAKAVASGSSKQREPLLKLRAHAGDEARDLGPRPANPPGDELWREERRGATVLLAGLADWDGTQLRRAALGLAGSIDQDVRLLLLDAAEVADEERALGEHSLER